MVEAATSRGKRRRAATILDMEMIKVINLEVDGQAVEITVTQEHSEALATWGFPPERNVYSGSWDTCQIDCTRTVGRRQPAPGDGRDRP